MRCHLPRYVLAAAAVMATLATDGAAETLKPQTVQAWNVYVVATEARIARELPEPGRFPAVGLIPDLRVTPDELSSGAIAVTKMAMRDRTGGTIDVPGGLIQHWRGRVMIPGISLDALLGRLQHPNERGPHQEDVLALRVLDRHPDRLALAIRMTRTKIVTVTYDTEHVIEYRHYGAGRASSRSVSRKIVEVEYAGTPDERALLEGQDRGFLWRMNSYWRYEEVRGGVVIELESLTLSRSIPVGLGVIVEPVVDRIARESIARTLENLRRTYGRGGNAGLRLKPSQLFP